MEPSIMTFVNLTHIDFSYNRLKEIPGAIGNLRELVVFRANGNLISELPSSMGFIETLESLALAENGMRSFCVHASVCTCTRLTDVRT
jgi:Leucine-rich repeat (LRR) protein